MLMTVSMWLTPSCFRGICWLYSVTLNVLWDQYFPSSEGDKIISPPLNRTKWLQTVGLRHSYSFVRNTSTDFPINLYRISVFLWNSINLASVLHAARVQLRATQHTSPPCPFRLAYCSSCLLSWVWLANKHSCLWIPSNNHSIIWG